MRMIVILLLLMLPTLTTAQPNALEAGTLVYGGLERTYWLYVPPGADGETPLPLVIALHPAGADGRLMAQITGFNTLAERDSVMMVYPDGPGGYWDYGADLPQWAGQPDIRDDPGFIAALLDTLEAEYAIDPQRIYAVGYSNGARMAFRLGCEAGSRVRAIAVVAATLTDEVSAACAPAKRTSVIYMHGTADGVTPWAGKPLRMVAGGPVIANALSALDTVDFWVAQNGCDPRRYDTNLGPQPDVAPVVLRELYRACEGGTVVDFYRVNDGGHEWFTYPHLNATQAIWEFFTGTARPAQR